MPSNIASATSTLECVPIFSPHTSLDEQPTTNKSPARSFAASHTCAAAFALCSLISESSMFHASFDSYSIPQFIHAFTVFFPAAYIEIEARPQTDKQGATCI